MGGSWVNQARDDLLLQGVALDFQIAEGRADKYPEGERRLSQIDLPLVKKIVTCTESANQVPVQGDFASDQDYQWHQVFISIPSRERLMMEVDELFYCSIGIKNLNNEHSRETKSEL